MRIGELSRHTGVREKTIRYYEVIGLLPAARRDPNGYRAYTNADVDRLQFVASARALGLSVEEVRDALAARDQGIAPCRRVLAALDARLADLDWRLADLLMLRDTVGRLRQEGGDRPLDDLQGQACVCHLIKQYGPNRQGKAQHGAIEHA